MTYDVTTLNGFTISPEVSLILSPRANFRFLVCSEVLEVTEKTLNASQMYFGFLFLKVELKKISVSHFPPASRLLRSPASRPFLSRLPYPSHPLFSQAPAPCPPPLKETNLGVA